MPLDDLRVLTPLLHAHVTPYGIFRPDMSKWLAIDPEALRPDWHAQRYFAPGDTNVFAGPCPLDTTPATGARAAGSSKAKSR